MWERHFHIVFWWWNCIIMETVPFQICSVHACFFWKTVAFSLMVKLSSLFWKDRLSLFIKEFFCSSFRFITKLRWRYRESPYTLYTCRLHYQHHSPDGTLFTKNEPTLICHHPPKSIVYFRVPSWCCTVYGFWQMYNNIYPSF